MVDVDKMEAGREMDALVAEKILGRRVEWHGGVPFWVGGEELPGSPYVLGGGKYGHSIKPYSTDIAAAWEVLGMLGRVLVTVAEVGFYRNVPQRPWRVRLIVAYRDWVTMEPTAPLAICKAALKVVGA